MAHTKGRVAYIMSSIFLLALMAVACYAQYIAQHHALPIQTTLGSFVIILPVVHGLCSWYLTRFSHDSRQTRSHAAYLSPILADTGTAPPGTTHVRGYSHKRGPILILLGLAVLTAVLATLSGTYLAPASSLDCGLREQWLKLFRAKNGGQIRKIQDALQCCGFRSVYDMAWPFPQTHGGRTERSTCSETYSRNISCFPRWRQEEQRIAGLLLIVCIGAGMYETIIIFVPIRPSWLQNFIGRSLRQQSSQSGERARSTNWNEDQYTDDGTEVLNEDGRREAREHGNMEAIEYPDGPNSSEHRVLLPSAQGRNLTSSEW